MVMSRDQNAGRSNTTELGNKSFERMEHLKYLENPLNNQNFIQKEIKSRLKSENASYHSVQSLMSSSLLFKHVNIKIYRTII
jgi:hypothetical protein